MNQQQRTVVQQALAKVRAAQQCHPNAVMTLLCEADELMEQLLEQPEEDCPHGADSACKECHEAAQPAAWVNLTDDEIHELWWNDKEHGDEWLNVLRTFRAAEVKLKEKNT